MKYFNEVPRTYLGLSKLIESLRMLSGWNGLPDLMEVELLVAISYFRIGSVDGLRQFESNDYLRRALGRRSAVGAEFDEWIRGGRGSIALSKIRELIEASPALRHSPRKASLNANNFKPQQLGGESSENLSAVSEGRPKCNQPFPLISESDRVMLEELIEDRIISIGRSCALPEFRLRKRRFWTEEDEDFLESRGYLVKPGFLSDEHTNQLRGMVYDLATTESINGEAYFYGNENRLQRVYNLLSKSNKFAELFLARPEVYEVAHQFFGSGNRHTPYYLSSFQANILNPGADAQVLHVDSSVPDPLPPWKVRLNVNLLLDPFTEQNGATLVYPGSHRFLRKPTSDDHVSPYMLKVIAPAGSLVLWTGHLWHQSGRNESRGPRAALLACFAASYLREVAVEENLLSVMNRDHLEGLPFEVKTILGYFHGRKD